MSVMVLPIRRASLAWALVLIAGCASSAGPAEVPAESGGGGGLPSTIVSLTNAERAKAGVAALRVSPQLMQAAQLQADQMARLQRMEHEISGARYPKPVDRLAAVGYQWGSYGENVAMGQSSAVAVMDSWMHSSGHRANILKGGFREIGVGVAHDSAGRPYYVQVFGSQL